MKMMQNGTKPLTNLYPRSWPGGWASVNRRATEKARPASSIEFADQIPSQGATKTVGFRFCEQKYAKNSGTILYPGSWSGAWALVNRRATEKGGPGVVIRIRGPISYPMG